MPAPNDTGVAREELVPGPHAAAGGGPGERIPTELRRFLSVLHGPKGVPPPCIFICPAFYHA